VTDRLVAKMERRHPHLFGDGERMSWEAVKAKERRDDASGELAGGAGAGVLSGLAKGLDPLTRAHRVQERVAGVGFDWSDYQGALAKVSEELDEVRAELAAGAERFTSRYNWNDTGAAYVALVDRLGRFERRLTTA
jgi:uncharacterized protein YabN with tetrapyrrole methylase and pyrophosphatase domain